MTSVSPGSARGARPLMILYGLGAAAVLIVAWLPLTATIDHILYEDCFYYLTVARNIIDRASVSLDGCSPTNGFHPLWMGICVAAQFVGTSALAPHVVLTVAALMHLGQAYLVFRILSALCDRAVAHCATIFYLFSYRVSACNLCGLETPVQGLLLLLVIRVFIRPGIGQSSLKHAVYLGTLLGLAVLSRFDLLLFLPFAVLFLFLDQGGHAGVWRRLRVAAVALPVCLVVLLPWFVWSYAHSHSLLPRSREALNLWAFEQFDLNHSLSENLSLLRSRVFGAAWWLSDTANLLGLWPMVLPSNQKLGGILLCLLFCAGAVLLWLTRDGPKRRIMWILAAYGTAHLAYYCLFASAQVRYLMPFCIVVILVAAMAADDFRKSHRQAGVRLSLVCVFALALINSTIAGVLAWGQHQGATRTHAGHIQAYQLADWVRSHTPEHSVIGTWNGGILSYYSGRTVVNLDGVINDDAIEAIRKHDLNGYIHRRGIEYLVDDEEQVHFFMSGYGGAADWAGGFSAVHRIGAAVVMRRNAP
jgi:hypothetical protein